LLSRLILLNQAEGGKLKQAMYLTSKMFQKAKHHQRFLVWLFCAAKKKAAKKLYGSKLIKYFRNITLPNYLSHRQSSKASERVESPEGHKFSLLPWQNSFLIH